MPTLLIVDDCSVTRRVIGHFFRNSNIDVLEAGSCRECLESVRERRPDVVILDLMLPDATGLETFKRVRAEDGRLPVILITATRSSEIVIEALKLGATDFLVKPIDKDMVLNLVSRALECRRLMQVPVGLGGEITNPAGEESANDPMVGSSAAMQEVYKAIGRVARQNLTVLIRGESGTGKELVARAIYQHSDRSHRTFLAINCAAIPETLLESELFGHEKGAFTGADNQRIGRFEQCHEGTLFLDEIGDMTPFTQSKLLRVLQEKCFQRVGGDKEIPADVRIIAATSRDLESMVERNEFRPDLYYRLSVFQIQLPPLRQRKDDLPYLVTHFLKRYGLELGCEFQSVTPEALELLCQHSWPGNVRELQSVIKQTLLHSTSPVIIPEALPHSIRNRATVAAPGRSDVPELDAFIDEQLEKGTESLYEDSIQLVERFLLTRVHEYTNGNQRQAAEILGITRTTLRTKMRTLGLETTGGVVEAPKFLSRTVAGTQRRIDRVTAEE